MDNDNKNNSIKSFLKNIEDRHVKMHSKSYFVVRTLLLLLGVLIFSLLILFIVSFVFFVLRQSGGWYAPAFGPRGFGLFLLTVPWILVVIALVFIAVLEYLVRRYSFGYRRSLMYTAIGVVVLALVGGFLIERTTVHHALFRQAAGNRLPFVGGLYKGFEHRKPGDMLIGQVVGYTDQGFIIETAETSTLEVVLTPETRLPFGADFELGDRVIVLGGFDGTKIIASGIRDTDEDFEFLPPPPMMMGDTSTNFFMIPRR